MSVGVEVDQGSEGDRPAVPPALAFLGHHGIPPQILAGVASRARRLRVDPVVQLLAEAVIDEAGYYRALAGEFGLAFADRPVTLLPGGDPAALRRSCAAAIAQGGGPRPIAVIAPRGAVLHRLFDAGIHGAGGLLVTTPRVFEESLRASHGAGIARSAAWDDAAGRSRLSARSGASRGQVVAAGFVLLPAAFCGPIWPVETFHALALLVTPVFLALTVLRLAAAFETPLQVRLRRALWRIRDADLPVYTVVVPLLREDRVVAQLLAGLAALDYPPAKLDVKLLVEIDDHVTRDALAGHELPAHVVVMLVPRGQPRTKPRALNVALAEARGDLFTVFDAEDVPDADQLRLSAARFAQAPRELACLQAHLVIDNDADGWLQALFALEYAGLFKVLNPGLLRGQLPILLGGTSNHFRTEVLREIGGWDAWNVTEDADIGFRLLRGGYRIGDLPSETWEEAPDSVGIWLKQRRRWIKGYIQTFVAHAREPLALFREGGVLPSLAALTLTLGSVLTALLYPALLVASWIAWRRGFFDLELGRFGSWVVALALTVSLCGGATMLMQPMLGAIRCGRPRLLLFLPLLPAYHMLTMVAAWGAVYDYLYDRFGWHKTAHGQARSSRRGLTDAGATPPPLRPAGARC